MKRTAAATFIDGLNVLGLLGAAAACRGGNSSIVADKVALFLVDLACFGTAKPPLVEGDEITLSGEAETELRVVAGSSYGSMLSVDGGSPLWKQRIIHQTLAKTQRVLDSPGVPSVAVTTVLCAIVCSGGLRTTKKDIQDRIAFIVIRALSDAAYTVFVDAENGSESTVDSLSLKKLLLASVLKLSSVSPFLVTKDPPSLLTGLMRAYATQAGMDQASEVACKLLVLQTLECLVDNPRMVGLKHAVISLLDAGMNSDSSILRSATAEVLNEWNLV